MDKLFDKYKALIYQVPTDFIRNIHDTIDWDDRLIAIVGARGVGKSTLVLQHIKLYEDISKTLYVSADDLWFTDHTLYDMADSFYKNGGRSLYIDEIHKYRNWAQEIKNIYDAFPSLRVLYTGSSILDLQKGNADLSRRLVEYHLYGLSFREYLEFGYGIKIPVHNLEQIISQRIEFPYKDYRPLELFKKYIREGYYPYYKSKNYYLRLQQVINRIIEVDIPLATGISVATVAKLRQLLYIIAQSVPFKPNYSKIARDLNVSRNAVADLIIWLSKAELINVLRDDTHGISALGKVEKIYLSNPNIPYAITDSDPDMGNIRETIFLASTKVDYNVVASRDSDFRIGKYTFEVGGKNKKHKQIRQLDEAFIVKDDIEYGHGDVIPLWTFGLLY